MSTNTSTEFRVLGTNDDVDWCSACGRTNLKRVVWIDGPYGVAHYGTDCAARTLGWSGARLASAIATADSKAQNDAREAARRCQLAAQALETFEARGASPALNSFRVSYMQRGGYEVLGSFPEWLAAQVTS